MCFDSEEISECLDSFLISHTEHDSWNSASFKVSKSQVSFAIAKTSEVLQTRLPIHFNSPVVDNDHSVYHSFNPIAS